MKIARCASAGRKFWGAVTAGSVKPIKGSPFESIEFSGAELPLDAVELLAPVNDNRPQIVVVGLNYRKHIEEAKAKGWDLEEKQEPVYFMVPSTALCGHKSPIKLAKPEHATQFEAELVLVIGKESKDVSVEKAELGIFGYTCGNDISDRTIQKADGQWTRAKGFSTYKPAGPWIETIKPPTDAAIVLRRNGFERQRAKLSDMIFPPAMLVSFISRHMCLFPGDLVFTGTPAGVGSIKPGDEVEVEIEGIGRLVNMVL